MSESPGRDRISLPSLFRARTGAIVVVTLLSLVGAALNLAQPLVVSELISRLGGEGAGRWVAALVGLLLGAVLIGAVQHYLLTRTAEQAVFDLRARIVTRMIRLPQKVYDTSHSGDMVTRLSTDTTVVREVFTGGLTEAVGSMFLVVGAIIAMSLIDPVMLFVVLGVTGAGVVTMLVTSRKIQTATTLTQDAVGRLSASMSRVLSAIRTVKASRAEDALEGQIVHDAAEARDLGIRIGRIEALLYPISGAVLQIAFLLVIGVGGSRVATGQMELGDLVAFILFLFMLISPVSTMFQSVMSIRSAQGAMDRINRLLDVPLERQGGEPALGAGAGGVVDPDAAGAAAAPGAGDAAGAGDTVLAFKDVSFGYELERPILRELSFEVTRGMTTAVVGPSGSGKSTVLSLIEGFYEPSSGRVLLDGRDMSGVPLAEVRGRIAYVEQNSAALAGTVGENLRLAVPEASEEACWDALEQVNLRPRFEAADGLDTVLGERGVNLSGGEQQRLALARALLGDADILLLDEPTSAVDTQNEQAIQAALARVGSRRTVIVVAHRMTTVQDAEQILVIRDGRLLASGRHEQLLANSPEYQALARSQFVAGQVGGDAGRGGGGAAGRGGAQGQP